jgi:hypothetical protein
MGRLIPATMAPSPTPSSTAGGAPAEGGVETLRQLLDNLGDDRRWLLRQLDSGRWPEWRLDLAALERELGQLLDQVEEQIG